mmetsp:Transcript_1955/g.4442  ORF Transcript_1955/g.4442 Transcript_1955/m.4442 type:complete len:200 (-) Transcript_1955:665-1264(-)
MMWLGTVLAQHVPKPKPGSARRWAADKTRRGATTRMMMTTRSCQAKYQKPRQHIAGTKIHLYLHPPSHRWQPAHIRCRERGLPWPNMIHKHRRRETDPICHEDRLSFRICNTVHRHTNLLASSAAILVFDFVANSQAKAGIPEHLQEHQPLDVWFLPESGCRASRLEQQGPAKRARGSTWDQRIESQRPAELQSVPNRS